MQHRYSSANRLGGLWLTKGAAHGIFCSWWWDSSNRTLYVRRGRITCTWTATHVSRTVVRRVLVDLLPELARGMAKQIERMEG